MWKTCCVEKAIPLKQGLKPLTATDTEEGYDVEKAIPLKQGLKPEIPQRRKKWNISRKGNSIKTRIETKINSKKPQLCRESKRQFH